MNREISGLALSLFEALTGLGSISVAILLGAYALLPNQRRVPEQLLRATIAASWVASVVFLVAPLAFAVGHEQGWFGVTSALGILIATYAAGLAALTTAAYRMRNAT